MIRRLIILLLIVGCVFAQESNPCKDETYLELKEKNLDEMSEREFEYYTRKDKECNEFNNENIEKVGGCPAPTNWTSLRVSIVS